jgi:hypothetical protein
MKSTPWRIGNVTTLFPVRRVVIAYTHHYARAHRARGVDFSSALLPLPWTVVHAMDERSPLHGATPASLAASDTEIIAILDGTDEVRVIALLLVSLVQLLVPLSSFVPDTTLVLQGCSEQLQARWSYTYRGASLSDGVSDRLVMQTKYHSFIRSFVQRSYGTRGWCRW